MIVHETSPTRIWVSDPTKQGSGENLPGSLEFGSLSDGDRYVLAFTPEGRGYKVDIGMPSAGYSVTGDIHSCLGNIAREIRTSLQLQQEMALTSEQRPSAATYMRSQRGGILALRIIDTCHALLGIATGSAHYPYRTDDVIECELHTDGVVSSYDDIMSFSLTPSVFALVGLMQKTMQRLVDAHPDFARDIPREFFPNISQTE